mmetsp:Transcript_21353/g.39075  ORF Transcript_21353/g.39075 Transcript_21353/m.39075 type:complete len:800 (-) Transcript_21353:46-2445(-)
MSLFAGCGACCPEDGIATEDEADVPNGAGAADPLAAGMPDLREASGYRSQMSSGSRISTRNSGGLAGLASAASEYLKKFPKESPCAGPDELRWINYMLTVMWPNIRKVMMEKGRHEILERTYVELQKHKEVKVQSFEVEFDPGKKPPILKGLHAYKKEQGEQPSLQVDVDVEWTPGREFVFSPKFKGTVKNFSIDTSNVFVSGLEFSSVVSCVLAPFIDKEPCFGVMQIFFYDPPALRMYMSGLKQLPIGKIIKNIMEKIILKVMEEAFVLPHRLMVPVRHDLPLETLVSMKSPIPIGLLEVEILEAENLIAADISLIAGKGSSDPYVEFSVGLAKMRTSTKKNTLNPKWYEGPDYFMVYDLSQVVRLEVYDDDPVYDDHIGLLPGYSVYWLCQEAEGKSEGEWFQLHAPENGDGKRKEAGRVKLRVRYLDLVDLEDGGSALMGPQEKPQQPWAQSPFVVSVKLLGLEGELAPGFVGSRCTVELQKQKPSEVDDDDDEDGDEDPTASANRTSKRSLPDPKKAGVLRKGLNAVKGVGLAVGKATTAVKAATGLGFGAREFAVSTKKRSTKARPWAGHIKEQKNSPAFAIPPMCVRAIEQLHRREKWEVDRIAEMFGVDAEAVKVAEGLRTNFAIVWSEASHFISTEAEPFAGVVRIDVHAAPGPVASQQKGKKTINTVPARQLVGDSGLIGSVKFSLKHETLPGDEPWRRRVRARLRRKKVDPELAKLVMDNSMDHLHGENQCDSTIGELVPGVLIEFLVEVRATKSAHSHNHIEREQVIVDKSDLMDSTRKRACEVILT